MIVDALCPVLVGTSGYSYTEWVDGGFYPQGTRTPEMLALYAKSFPVVELNYTWYQMIQAEAISRMIAKAPKDFLFAAKLTRTLTHERDRDWKQELQRYREGIKPLQKQLAAILIQLPPEFSWNVKNRYYLAWLLDSLHDFPVAVEFRHISWARDSVFAELEQRQVTLVTVDAPNIPKLFPCVDLVTNPSLFLFVFMAVICRAGSLEICSRSLTTRTLKTSCSSGMKRICTIYEHVQERGLSFLIIMYVARHL